MKYNRKDFWKMSLLIIAISWILTAVLKFSESTDSLDNFDMQMYTIFIVVVYTAFMMIILAGRMKDYGSNPMFVLFALIPFIGILMGLYYGIKKSKKEKTPLTTTSVKAEKIADNKYEKFKGMTEMDFFFSNEFSEEEMKEFKQRKEFEEMEKRVKDIDEALKGN